MFVLSGESPYWSLYDDILKFESMKDIMLVENLEVHICEK